VKDSHLHSNHSASRRTHDLRHFAATTMLSTQVPLAMASKTMRHSTLSTTTEIYGHLLRHAAHPAVDAIDHALTTADNAKLCSRPLLVVAPTLGGHLPECSRRREHAPLSGVVRAVARFSAVRPDVPG
jgi:hypothetical protein